MKNNRLIGFTHVPVRIVLCTVLVAVLSINTAVAQDWRLEPVVKVGAEYDDNAALNVRTDQEAKLTGYLVDLSANINYASPTTTFFAQPRALIRSYPGESQFDSDDYFLRSNLRHEGVSNVVGFRFNYDRQSIRTAERAQSNLDIQDPNELTNDDTGQVLLFGDRYKWRLSPYWTHQMSDTTSLGADFDYYNASYDDALAGRLNGYTDSRINLNFRHSLSNLTTGQVTVTGRTFDSDILPDNINGYGVLAGIEHRLSQTTQLTAMAGVEDTNQPGVQSDPELVGYATLIRNLQTIRMFAQYRRSVNSSGVGRLSIRNSLNVNFRRRLNERIAAGLGIRAYQTSGAGGSFLVEDRNYVQLQSSFTWYLSAAFVIEADYRYTVLDRSGTLGERSNSNLINLWFSYQPKTVPRI